MPEEDVRDRLDSVDSLDLDISYEAVESENSPTNMSPSNMYYWDQDDEMMNSTYSNWDDYRYDYRDSEWLRRGYQVGWMVMDGGKMNVVRVPIEQPGPKKKVQNIMISVLGGEGYRVPVQVLDTGTPVAWQLQEITSWLKASDLIPDNIRFCPPALIEFVNNNPDSKFFGMKINDMI